MTATRYFLFLTMLALASLPLAWADTAGISQNRLAAAGENRSEIEKALAEVPEGEREGLLFLLQHMPDRDLESLSAEFLLENTRLAYESRNVDPWAKEIPKEIFLNNTLPYASINERRDAWRADFRKRFLPLVVDAKTPSEVAAILNQKIFGMVNVRYSTKRKKADQSPYESIEGSTASCTGLSVLLIDACRAVGVPARLVGTPLWSDDSGNHSWVEIWDNGWHFTGAAEPTGMNLNQGWFVGRASSARRDEPVYAIYATSFKDTPIDFPCVWAPHIKYIPAVNVTDRYTALAKPLPEGHVRARFVVFGKDRSRVAVPIVIRSGDGILFDGLSKDERFDANDHVTVSVPEGSSLKIDVGTGDDKYALEVNATKDEQLFTLSATAASTLERSEQEPNSATPPRDGCSQCSADAGDETEAAANPAPIEASKNSLTQLETFAADGGQLSEVTQKTFAKIPLTREDAINARKILNTMRTNALRESKKAILESSAIELGELKMPFTVKAFGEKPAEGWSVYLSLHGGGGAPAQVNNGQWENQKKLYTLEEGLYVVPRAPTDTWNLWHQGHIDPMFVALIDALVIANEANWNRVYVLGYSAGGDGVYQLAPRMSDRWAGAAMMAGHPNETSPVGLRNVPFALQMGGKDSAYNRNQIAEQWKEKLADLQKTDPDGYTHFVKIYPDKGHWMNLEDRVAIPWMSQYSRNPVPKKIVWKQDDVLHSHHYWLEVDEQNRRPSFELRASVEGQTVMLASDAIHSVRVHLDDSLVDLDQPVEIVFGGETVFSGTVTRTIQQMAETLQSRFDPNLIFPAAVTVKNERIESPDA